MGRIIKRMVFKIILKLTFLINKGYIKYRIFRMKLAVLIYPYLFDLEYKSEKIINK